MKFVLASIAHRAVPGPMQVLLEEYLGRLGAYAPSEQQLYRTEDALLNSLRKMRIRTAPWLVLLDGRGVALSSSAFAGRVRAQQEEGRQIAVFAVGPADGWSDEALALAESAPQDTSIVSFGPITLPHELARVVLAEQLYRTCTILAGHPYHCGH